MNSKLNLCLILLSTVAISLLVRVAIDRSNPQVMALPALPADLKPMKVIVMQPGEALIDFTPSGVKIGGEYMDNTITVSTQVWLLDHTNYVAGSNWIIRSNVVQGKLK